MTMAAEAFVDTNVLLRAFHSTFPEHERVRALFDRLLDEEYELWISRQVIREYLVQVTHPRTFVPALTLEQVLHQLATFETLFHIADETHEVTAHLLALLQTYQIRGKQIHDANIVATMHAHNLGTLLTLNVDDFRRFADRIAILTPETTS